jgi:hypothetical protein
MHIVEVAMTPFGWRIHADAVTLKHYAPDTNQATPAQYYISDLNFNMDISLSYGSVIETHIQT